MKFVILAYLVISFIVFVVMVVKAAKNWRWYHITCAVITMILAMLFLYPTAGVLKSRQAWHKINEKLEKELVQVEEENERLQYGDPTDPTTARGIKKISMDLGQLGVEAGRRWRSLRMQGQPDRNTGEITLVKPQPQAVPGAGAQAAGQNPDTEPLIPVGLVVYGFAERKPEWLGFPVPMIYLGEFIVKRSVPNSVTIAPTFPLEANQVDAIFNRNLAQSWSVYELLPLDGHGPFVAEGSKPTDDNVLGRINDKLVNAILANNEFGSAAPETIQNYLDDGKRGSPENPSTRWIKIRFEKKFTIDVDSQEQRGALEGGFFDVNGRAVDSRLQRDDTGSVSFNPGDELVVKEEAAKQLTDVENVATLVDTYFLRPLNDYRYVLRRIRLQIRELDIRIEEMKYEKQVLEAATAATVSLLEKGQIEKLKLEQDLAQHQVETKAIQQYHDGVKEELRQMTEAAAKLYRSNQEQAQKIRRGASNAGMTDT